MPKKNKILKWMFVIAVILLALIIVPFFNKPVNSGNAEQISMVFEEYLAQNDQSWFLTGKKEYSLQAMMVSKETAFHNDLEVVDYTVTDDGITVILKGSYDEMWASKLPKVLSTYRKPDGTSLTEEDFAEKDTWIDIITIPEPNAYYAMHVPLNVSVTVNTAWGDELHTNLPNAPHGNGDFLVCRAGADGKPDLSDVWILNGVVFPEYYDTDQMIVPLENDQQAFVFHESLYSLLREGI